MPPEGRLSDEELSYIRKWIEAGAVDPRTSSFDASKKELDIEAGKQWWSFQPLKPLQRSANANNQMDSAEEMADLIDFEIQRKLQIESESHVQDSVQDVIKLSEEARPEILIRRLSYDLTGLPPSAFRLEGLAYEQIVDQLIASPQFGEKWGRHWLDVARYADSNGSSFNPPFPVAWRYRNWVIDSVNADLPVDQFIRMQIAGDLLPYQNQQERDHNLIATGFLMLGSKVLGTFDKEQLLLDVVDEQVDTIGKAFLGMTLGCARCHDHKFDPIPQRDYYALAGILTSTTTLDDRLGGPKEDESDWSRRGLGDGGDQLIL